MGKVYVVKNVYDATIERLEKIFSENFAVYFSFSGGKDSSVMLQLANLVAKKKIKNLMYYLLIWKEIINIPLNT